MRDATGPPEGGSGSHDFAERAAAHRPSLLRLLRGLLPTPEDAEDVLQETLLHAFLGLPALRRPELFGPWLRTVAYNRAMDWQRRRYREAARRVHVVAAVADDGGMGQAAERLDLVAALGLLAPQDRGLIVMRYGEQLSAAEIARRQGGLATTVRSRLHRVRRILRAELQDQGGLDNG